MFKITSFEKAGRMNKIFLTDLENPEVPKLLGLLDGILEAHAGAYGIGVGAALSLIMADGLIEGVEAPERTDPDCKAKVAKIIREAPRLFDWSDVDRDQILADVTLAEDAAADMVNTWAEDTRQALATDDAPASHEDAQALVRERAASYAAGHQRRQEELLAEEFVGQITEDRKAAAALKNDPGNVASVQRNNDTMRVEW